MNNATPIDQLNLVSVAYVGDAVFSLFVRERLIRKFDCKSGKLHLLANDYVKASSQAKILEAVLDKLSAGEIDIVRRARNTHTHCKAKNAGLAEYKKATALEGLIGYLFLSEQKQRLDDILELCARAVEEKGDCHNMNKL